MRARRANWERKLRSAGESLARWKSSRIDTDNFIPYIYTLCKIHMRNTTAKMNANLLLKEWKLRKRIPSGASLGCEFSVAELLRDEGRGAGTGKRPTFAKSAKMGASALCLAPWKSEISPGRLATCRPSRAYERDPAGMPSLPLVGHFTSMSMRIQGWIQHSK